MLTVGELVKYLRIKNNLTQKGLGKRLGLNHTRVCKIESDVSDSVGLQLINRIARLGFNMEPVHFLSMLYWGDDQIRGHLEKMLK